MPDAREFLTTLVGKPLRTLTHSNPNRVLAVEGNSVRVQTDDSGTGGALVPIRYVQEAMDALYRDGELRVSKSELHHRRTRLSAPRFASFPTSRWSYPSRGFG